MTHFEKFSLNFSKFSNTILLSILRDKSNKLALTKPEISVTVEHSFTGDNVSFFLMIYKKGVPIFEIRGNISFLFRYSFHVMARFHTNLEIIGVFHL